MNSQIRVNTTKEGSGWNFQVVVTNNGTETNHSVSMGKDYYNSLDTTKQPWVVIENSFRFLLSKETKEEILPEFDISLISHYFPEFKKVLKRELIVT